MKRLFTFAMTLLTMCTMAPSLVYAQAPPTPTPTPAPATNPYITSVTTGLDAAADGTGLKTACQGQGCVIKVVEYAVDIIFALSGVALVCLFLWGGFQWMTAGGDPKKTAAGRDTLINAIVGLLIMVAAFSIAKFVIDKLIGALAV